MSTLMKINEHGGVYTQGRLYSKAKKLETVIIYYEMRDSGMEVTHRTLACHAKVGKTYAGMIIDEIESGTISFGVRVLHNNNNQLCGVRSKMLMPVNKMVLLGVYYQNHKSLFSHYQA